MKVFIFNQTKFHIEDYRETISKVFDSIENDKGINVILLNSEDMIKLNKKYRGIDSDTDVLRYCFWSKTAQKEIICFPANSSYISSLLPTRACTYTLPV